MPMKYMDRFRVFSVTGASGGEAVKSLHETFKHIQHSKCNASKLFYLVYRVLVLVLKSICQELLGCGDRMLECSHGFEFFLCSTNRRRIMAKSSAVHLSGEDEDEIQKKC